MALSDKTNLLVKDYIRQQYPTLEEGVQQYLDDELSRIELALASVARASIQVADAAPDNPVKGMVRYAVSPWDPLGNGFSGLVVYSGNAWVQV